MTVSVQSRPSAVTRFLSAVRDVLASVSAAGAAANAVENHRQPDAADLAVLGIEGARFKQYY